MDSAPDYNEHDRYFFHYTTRDAAFEHIIPERRMRLSPYRLMGDPLEASGPQLAGSFWIPQEPDAEEDLQTAYFEAVAEVQKVRGQTKMLSLTVDAPRRMNRVVESNAFVSGWARARMWEHYAERHQGVCLVFERHSFEAGVLAQLRERSPDAGYGPVAYSDEGLAASAAASVPIQHGVPGIQIARDHVKKHARDFYFLKVSDWASEHEYRFIEPSTNDDYSYVDVGDSFVGVIAGHRFPTWQRFSATKICGDAGVDLRHVFWEFLNRPMLGRWPTRDNPE
jgi:hypothetical protein